MVVGEGRRRDAGKDFWEGITLNPDFEDEQELVCEERQVLGKRHQLGVWDNFSDLHLE